MTVVSEVAYMQLKEIFSLPEECISATIHLKVNNPVTIDCLMYADINTGETITKKYKLEEIIDDAIE